MDVRFCEGRNHRREAHVRAAGSARVRGARSSEARLRRIFFSLTKTYMDIDKDLHGHRQTGRWNTCASILKPVCELARSVCELCAGSVEMFSCRKEPF